jgi:hypothetical protein
MQQHCLLLGHGPLPCGSTFFHENVSGGHVFMHRHTQNTHTQTNTLKHSDKHTQSRVGMYSKTLYIHYTMPFQWEVGLNETAIFYVNVEIQWGKEVFSQPPIVQVLPLNKMRDVIFIIGTLQL